MPNQINSNNTANTYSASDLNWAHEVAESDLVWATGGLQDIADELKAIRANLKEWNAIQDGVLDVHFSKIKRQIGMLQYVLDDRLNYHATEAEAYKNEWEESKKGGAK